MQTLKDAGFSPEQIAALPNVRALTDEQIDLAYEIGAIPAEAGELTLKKIAALSDDDIDYSDIPKPINQNGIGGTMRGEARRHES